MDRQLRFQLVAQRMQNRPEPAISQLPVVGVEHFHRILQPAIRDLKGFVENLKASGAHMNLHCPDGAELHTD
jgi:hypothetical protein